MPIASDMAVIARGLGRGLVRAVVTTLLLAVLGAAPPARAAGVPTPSSELEQAESLRLTDNAAFVRLLGQLDARKAAMTPTERWHLAYLNAWQHALEGKYPEASAQLQQVIADSPDATLGFRARATLINVLASTRQFEAAYRQLDQLMRDFPGIHDPAARFQSMSEASTLLTMAGQTDLAEQFARQMLQNIPPGQSICLAQVRLLDALTRNYTIKADDPAFNAGIDACLKDHQILTSDVIRVQHADVLMHEGRVREALRGLLRFHDEVRSLGYAQLITDWDSMLADALYHSGRASEASQYAKEGLQAAKGDDTSAAVARAYRVLYEVARQSARFAEALSWHEKYMRADKGHLDAVNASYLAYQRVKQQVDAKQRQLAQADSQNKILKLQQALDLKAVETGRLYISLLLLGLVLIVVLLIRLKHSQLRFKRLARSDSLTGILNRQHFVDSAGRMLRLAERSSGCVSLILIDLDHFKLVNDNHGHMVGDEVLKHAVAKCLPHVRPGDLFGRLGGEEFAILLPDLALEQVVARAEKIREDIAAVAEGPSLCSIVVSASFGVSSSHTSGFELRQLLIDADGALYQAKRAGRNRVVTSKVAVG